MEGKAMEMVEVVTMCSSEQRTAVTTNFMEPFNNHTEYTEQADILPLILLSVCAKQKSYIRKVARYSLVTTV